MSYYLGKEYGYDSLGAMVDEYVVYLLVQNDQHTQSLAKIAGFTTLKEASNFLEDCYEKKISAERIDKIKMEARKGTRLHSLSSI